MIRDRLIWIGVVLLLSVVALCMLSVPVIAGTTGIVAGTVTDADTGAKLAGVNVVIEGTSLTTVTDKDGYFAITNVAPGFYRITASLVGYGDVQVTGISVVMDVVTKVGVQLTAGVVEEEQVVVADTRPMINPDVTPTMYIVDQSHSEAIKGQPNMLYSAPGLVETQPGIVADEYSVPHIRGGRADQIGWTIDGIPIFDPVTNGFGTNLITVGRKSVV